MPVKPRLEFFRNVVLWLLIAGVTLLIFALTYDHIHEDWRTPLIQSMQEESK